MSKNFELLYQTGKAMDMLQPEVEPEAKTLPLQEVSAATPAVEVDGMAREELTKLVHRLFLLPGTEAPRHVVFTSTELGNGCTWMCARTAEILASQVGNSVCVVDCNLRSPSLHDEYAVENHYGLANALAEDGPVRQYARQLSRPNLWLVSCGAGDANSESLLTSGRMRARISELRAEFDYVLMDVAPMNICNHSLIFGGWMDGVVLVLKANSSRRDSTRDAMKQLQASSVRMLGAVLNQRTFPIPERIYKHL
ncbi:MAG: CpsD/CapB family tyrosine-protein kinase [Terriglobales bacterium]